MEITKEQITQLSVTAAIELSPAELEEQLAALEKTAVYTAWLGEIDTKGMPLQTHPFAETGLNRLREDEVTNENHAKDFTAAAPDSSDSYFRVPRTVEE